MIQLLETETYKAPVFVWSVLLDFEMDVHVLFVRPDLFRFAGSIN